MVILEEVRVVDGTKVIWEEGPIKVKFGNRQSFNRFYIIFTELHEVNKSTLHCYAYNGVGTVPQIDDIKTHLCVSG